MTQRECEALLGFTLRVGSRMIECGAEAWRAENTMQRLFRAYGLEVMDTHVIATQAGATVRDDKGHLYSVTRAVDPLATNVDLEHLEAINATARWICTYPPSVWDLPDKPEETLRPWKRLELLGYVIVGAVFAPFFGGGPLEALFSALIGAAIFAMDHVRYLHRQNRVIYTFFACFVSGVLARAVGLVFPPVAVDIIMIGDVMIFIPGLSVVNGVRELFYADILTGLYRIVEALLGTGAIALGFALALMLGGGLG